CARLTGDWYFDVW
nr:immunoglobulin heavy chain junction region [Mus musculus]